VASVVRPGSVKGAARGLLVFGRLLGKSRGRPVASGILEVLRFSADQWLVPVIHRAEKRQKNYSMASCRKGVIL
jgi:hypothetical protein